MLLPPQPRVAVVVVGRELRGEAAEPENLSPSSLVEEVEMKRAVARELTRTDHWES
jgi:hypothetical protein